MKGLEKQLSFNNGKNCWFCVDSHSTLAIDELVDKYGLSDEMLLYALDKNERARVEYDVEHKALLVVFNAPAKEKRKNHFFTHPITFILKGDNLFTFFTEETEYIVPMIENILRQDPQQSKFILLFQSLFLIADAFFPMFEEITAERNKISDKLRGHTTNKHLLALSDLSIGQVYIVTATKQNVSLIETIKGMDIIDDKVDMNEKEELDDALIEAKQADEMAQLTSQLLQQLSSTYNNLLNNNLNDTMKLLTVWSLILTIPTIVTGFYGMNVGLPAADSPFSWIFALMVSLALSIWLLIILWRRIK